MLIREISKKDLLEVTNMFNKLAFYIKDRTNDPYFDFKVLTTDEIYDSLDKSIDNPDFKVLVATEEDKLIGFISGEIRDNFLPISSVKKVGYISAAYINPDYRGRGIIKELVKKLDDFFLSSSINYVELNVLSKNIQAIKAWNRLGFSTFREQMRKNISCN